MTSHGQPFAPPPLPSYLLALGIACTSACVIADLDPEDEEVLAEDETGSGDCPTGGVRGSGTHRLFTQGYDEGKTRLEDGTFPLLHQWAEDGGDAELCNDEIFVEDENGNATFDPGEDLHPLGPDELVHGEHFLVGVGSFVEFTIPLCEDITGNVTFYIPNYDHEGSEVLHQLFVVSEDGEEFLIAETIDDEAGQMGYNPFVRAGEGNDPDVQPGDKLMLRTTNLNGIPYSVMVWMPPSEYESWLLVEVP
jgi:hypothetical protein